MIESLKNNLVQACDGEKITLHCPRNTHILIQTAFYGRLVPSVELCPVTSTINSNKILNTNQFDKKMHSYLSSGNKATHKKSLLLNENNLTNLAIATPTETTKTLKILAKRSHKHMKHYNAALNFEDTSCDVAEAHTVRFFLLIFE